MKLSVAFRPFLRPRVENSNHQWMINSSERLLRLQTSPRPSVFLPQEERYKIISEEEAAKEG